MTSSNFEHPSVNGIKIDTRYLLRQLPSLIQIRRKQQTWNDFGTSLVNALLNMNHVIRRIHGSDADQLSEWDMAKQLIFGVLATDDSQYDAIRKRLGNLESLSTASILSLLGLWLAGVLETSVTVTKPMVAVVLFAVAEAGGDWRILND